MGKELKQRAAAMLRQSCCKPAGEDPKPAEPAAPQEPAAPAPAEPAKQ